METSGPVGGTVPRDEDSPPEVEHEPTVTFVPIEPGEHPVTPEESFADVPGIEGYALVVQRGPRAGMTWLLSDAVTTIGRHPDDAIFLDDITVSRHHARFILDGGRLILEDEGSTNGTYVNGLRTDRAVLEAGDEVIIGKYHFVVARGDG